MIDISQFRLIKFDQKASTVVLSHNDVDGAGPIILADQYFVDLRYFTAANATIDKLVKLVLYAPEYRDVKYLFITDCSIMSKDLADTISRINEKGKKKIFLFDHHGTAQWLNDYDWATVTNEEGVSGSWLFFSYMKTLYDNSFSEVFMENMRKLMLCISDWDTWQWVKHNDEQPKKLSTLYTNTGIHYFLAKYKITVHEKNFQVINTWDEALLQDIQNKQEHIIIPSVKKSARILEIPFRIGNSEPIVKKVKCVQVTDAPGDLAEQLYEDDVDYVIMLYPDKVSVRSRIDDIDLGAWAKAMANGDSGGGHSRAAGFTINAHNRWILDEYLNARF